MSCLRRTYYAARVATEEAIKEIDPAQLLEMGVLPRLDFDLLIYQLFSSNISDSSLKHDDDDDDLLTCTIVSLDTDYIH